MTLHPKLNDYVAAATAAFAEVDAQRRAKLEQLSAYVRERHESADVAQLTFICTHNSRRSHMSQLWAAVAAAHYGVRELRTYSGGTEATAFNPRAVAAMERAGFSIVNPGGDNPRYEVSFDPDGPSQVCFSKVFDDPSNPQSEFAAVMTCTSADEACPMVPGAALRVAIPWHDPKAADDTPQETARYDERCRQIAIEMLYTFSKV